MAASDSWYKTATPRKEVREGRSFNPDEFAIALEQVVGGTAPEDYNDPLKFFSRTCFTRALREHAGMVLRRLAGETSNTAPVLTLITQFGGGKTHTLTTLFHIAKHGDVLYRNAETSDMLSQAELPVVENVQVATFVGNAWDPRDGQETPWIDIARQLAGDAGVTALGPTAKTTPPGTESLLNVFKAANGPVLILMDEVLNFYNRHRNMAEQSYAFFDNLNRAITGMTHAAMVISLPRSQVEMTDWDLQWQEKITKVVRRVAKDLIANDEAEIAEVVRRRLFEDLGAERTRKAVAKAHADWCFERRAQLPAEWTAVDTAATETKAREFLRDRFEACYPFHPATLSVFQRKWQALAQYQQTRGTLAMLAQWVSLVYHEGYEQARREPLITLGRAPLESQEFRAIVLGQLGETRLIAAIDADIAGQHAHARALDADSKGALRGIHRRVATAILFESSGGQIDKTAHLPELRFALGAPELDTTSIDNAALALESKAFFIRKVSSDGFRIGYKPTLKKVVSDRRASLDQDSEVRPEMRAVVKSEFEKGAHLPLVSFPEDAGAVQDSPKLTLVIIDPDHEWSGDGDLRKQIAEWTTQRGKSPRLYPGSLVWCVKKPGRDLRDKVEAHLAWKRVAKEVTDGHLGTDLDPSDRTEIRTRVQSARDDARDEVWGAYRFAIISDAQEADGLRPIDLGAGHSSNNESLCDRIVGALKSQGLLSESVGAGYLDRNWPPALKDSGEWPLNSLRQAFLNGSLTRLVDSDAVLRTKLAEFVEKGDFGLGSGRGSDGSFERIWFEKPVSQDELTFDGDVYLLKKERVKQLAAGEPSGTAEPTSPITSPTTGAPEPISGGDAGSPPIQENQSATVLLISGSIPPELWQRVGTKLIPKLRSGEGTSIQLELKSEFKAEYLANIKMEIQQILTDLGVNDSVTISETSDE